MLDDCNKIRYDYEVAENSPEYLRKEPLMSRPILNIYDLISVIAGKRLNNLITLPKR